MKVSPSEQWLEFRVSPDVAQGIQVLSDLGSARIETLPTSTDRPPAATEAVSPRHVATLTGRLVETQGSPADVNLLGPAMRGSDDISYRLRFWRRNPQPGAL